MVPVLSAVYAADKEKNLDEGEQQYAVTGIGCRAESAAREMAAVQRRFGKVGGNVAYHAYQSFKTGEVTAEECHRIGVETARRLWGNDRQVLVVTHFNTGTYHNHFVVNPVNMWTGKKLEAKYEVYYKLRDMSDRCGIDDINSFAETFAVCNRLGGNLKKVVVDSRDIISDKIEIEMEIQTTVAANKNEINIMCVMPFVIIAMMGTLGQASITANTPLNVLVKLIAIFMFVIAYKLGRKITDIKV